jgi:hypothetical protein
MGPGKKGECVLWKDFKVSFKNREQQRIWKIRQYNYICGKLGGISVRTEPPKLPVNNGEDHKN